MPRTSPSIALCWMVLVGCNAAVDPLSAGDVGRTWAMLRGHGHTLAAAQTYWFEWKDHTLGWNWAYQAPTRQAPANSPATGEATLTEWIYGLAPATAYDYRVCGIAAGETAPSCTEPLSFTTQLPGALRWVVVDPAAPTQLAFEDGTRFVPWGNNYTNANANHVRNRIPEDLMYNNPFFDRTVNQYLDFISPHLYPDAADNGTAKIQLAAALSSSTGKPVIVGETFSLGGDPGA